MPPSIASRPPVSSSRVLPSPVSNSLPIQFSVPYIGGRGSRTPRGQKPHRKYVRPRRAPARNDLRFTADEQIIPALVVAPFGGGCFSLQRSRSQCIYATASSYASGFLIPPFKNFYTHPIRKLTPGCKHFLSRSLVNPSKPSYDRSVRPRRASASRSGPFWGPVLFPHRSFMTG